MILLQVCRKNWISSLRGEYLDFIISRFTFTVLTMATALVLFRLNNGQVSQAFLQATGSADYLGYMVVGTALFGTTHGILLNVSRVFMTERREGTLETLLIIPFKRWKYFGGTQLHQLMLTGLDVIFAWLIALLLGVTFKLNLPTLICGFLLLFLTLYGLALIISLIMIALRDTYFIQNSIIPLVLILGGYLFPVESLPPPLLFLTRLLPIHRAVHWIRAGILWGESLEYTPGLLKYYISGLLLALVGYLLLPYIERKVLEDYLS